MLEVVALQQENKRLRERIERLQAHIRSESSRLAQIDASRNKAEAEVERLQKECAALQSWADHRSEEAEKKIDGLIEENENLRPGHPSGYSHGGSATMVWYLMTPIGFPGRGRRSILRNRKHS